MRARQRGPTAYAFVSEAREPGRSLPRLTGAARAMRKRVGPERRTRQSALCKAGTERRPTGWSGAVRRGDLAGLWPGGPAGRPKAGRPFHVSKVALCRWTKENDQMSLLVCAFMISLNHEKKGLRIKKKNLEKKRKGGNASENFTYA